jgi:nitroimidazol reductase NimA-like FMN-containing flavoprotein (pyridoxamine 5'-phosphate oxidase superfamily)
VVKDEDRQPDLWPSVPQVLGVNRYMVLATADADGTPWATPVYFAPSDEMHLYWVSSPEARHSRNIALRPEVAITVFDSQVSIGSAEAVYAEATAVAVDDAGHDRLLEVLNSRLPPGKTLGADDVRPTGPLQIYCASVSQHYVLVRGGDDRFDNELDARLEVHPPS